MYKIESTGGYNNDYMFKHMILTEEQYANIINNGKPLKAFAEENQVDYISIIKNESVSFMHITSTSNKKSISKNGLTVNSDEFVMDLGRGIYAVKDTEDLKYKGIDNLKTYAEDFESKKLLLVTGEYNGEFIECVYGYQHEGYIVFHNSVSSESINDLESMNVEDFLYLY